MGITMQQLAQQMTAQEFGLHLLLEQVGTREKWPDPDAPVAGADSATGESSLAQSKAIGPQVGIS
jgi:hypothetical protein